MKAAKAMARTMLRTLAEGASKNPIEVIVTGFILVTLAYFRLVQAVASSRFFEPIGTDVDALAATARWGAAGKGGVARDALHQLLPERSASTFVRPAGSNADLWLPVDDAGAEGVDKSSQATLHYVAEPLLVVDSEALSDGKQSLAASALPKVATSLFAQLGLKAGSRGAQLDAQQVGEDRVAAYGSGRIHQDVSVEARREFLELALADNTLEAAVNASAERKADAPWQLLPLLSDYDLDTFHPNGRGVNGPEQLRRVRWAVYTGRALVLRFWALIRKADSADIFVMLSAYVLMHFTFLNLFLSMRKFGSKFWMGFLVLTSSISAFLCALAAAHMLGVTVDPICLSEALPFLVIIVGFEKPYLLTRAVFTHPAAAPAPDSESFQAPTKSASSLSPLDAARAESALQSALPSDGSDDAEDDGAMSREESFVRALTARLKSDRSLRLASRPPPMPVHEVIVAAVDSVGMQILRDYIIEIAVMAVGATSGVSGLREFCQLAALILAFDAFALIGFYCAALTVIVEVHRIKLLRGMPRPRAATPPNVDSDEPLSGSGLATPTSSNVASSPTRESARTSREGSPQGRAPTSRLRKLIKLVFGKVPFERRSSGQRENPLARLKLLLVTSFLILHSLNMVSTLTTQTALSRHRSTDAPSPFTIVSSATTLLDASPASPSVAPLLRQLASSTPRDANVRVRIMDPIVFVLVDSSEAAVAHRAEVLGSALHASGLKLALPAPAEADATSKSARTGRGASSLAVLDSFISTWTAIVGDPIISKWISLFLAISIFLNAYLLKGIASGNAAVAQGSAAGAAALAVARMVGAHLDREASKAERTALSSEKLLKAALPRGSGESSSGTAKAGQEGRQELTTYHQKLATTTASAAKTYLEAPLPPHGHVVPAKAVNGSSNGVRDVQVRREARSASSQDQPVTLSTSSITGGTSQQPAGFVGPNGSVDVRPFEELMELYAGGAGVFVLNDEEIVQLAQRGKIAGYALEKVLQDHERAVRVRRALISRASATQTLERSKVPFTGYDYSQVMGACCENVVGFVPLPLGIAGPLRIDGEMMPIPMATTEGTLVASTSRGCKALNSGGGVTTVLTQDAMTRGPALEFPNIASAARAKRWVDSAEGAAILKEAFDSTSRFARLSSLTSSMAGRTLYVRFATSTGDAMGMNMIGKGCNEALSVMGRHFPEMKLLALSGNYCIDKKPSAINWILGRGKSVVAEAVVPAKTVETVLKTTVPDLVNLNLKKNLVGSAMAASIGGMNAHAANIVAAFFLATGQDPAQVVESSMCMTLLEATSEGDLLMTVSMPSLEVGTVGGGTFLHAQRAVLEMLGCAGAAKLPGANAQKLARCIAAAVMAGELSLLSALAANQLIQAHMKHNRSAPPTPGTQTPLSHDAPTPVRRDFVGGSLTPLVAPPVAANAAASGRASGSPASSAASNAAGARGAERRTSSSLN